MVVAILFYDAYAKKHFFGPPSMGLCRALNILIGVSPQLPFIMRGVSPDLAPGGMALAWSLFWWTFPLGNGVYITGDINPEDIARINEARVGQEDPLGEEGSGASRLTIPNPQEA